MPNRRPSRRMFLAAKVVTSTLLFSLALVTVDAREVVEYIKRVPMVSLAAACLLLIVQTVVLAVRWQGVMAAIGWPLARARAIALTFMGLFSNQLLPTNLSGDALRIWLSRQSGIPLCPAVSGVLLERVSGVLVLMIAAAPLCWAWGSDISNATLRLGLTAALVMALVGVALLACIDRIPAWLWPARRPGEVLTQLGSQSHVILASPGACISVILLSALSHVLAASAALVIAKGLGVALPFGPWLALIVPVLLVGLIPFSFAGLGPREGAMVLMLGFAGVAPEHAIAISILFGMALLAASLPGGLLLLFWREPARGRLALRHGASDSEP